MFGTNEQGGYQISVAGLFSEPDGFIGQRGSFACGGRHFVLADIKKSQASLAGFERQKCRCILRGWRGTPVASQPMGGAAKPHILDSAGNGCYLFPFGYSFFRIALHTNGYDGIRAQWIDLHFFVTDFGEIFRWGMSLVPFGQKICHSSTGLTAKYPEAPRFRAPVCGRPVGVLQYFFDNMFFDGLVCVDGRKNGPALAYEGRYGCRE